MSDLDERTLRLVTKWLGERPTEHATTELASMMREFGISNELARKIRSVVGRTGYTDCRCCEAIGDHACGGECQRCSGSGRNPSVVACELPHSLDCTCSWAEEM